MLICSWKFRTSPSRCNWYATFNATICHGNDGNSRNAFSLNGNVVRRYAWYEWNANIKSLRNDVLRHAAINTLNEPYDGRYGHGFPRNDEYAYAIIKYDGNE